jgi:chemotaxis protein MotB
MSNRRQPRSHSTGANHDRWIISYADFVTLLFAFFVVLFATSSADMAKARAVSEAVKAAFSERTYAQQNPSKKPPTTNTLLTPPQEDLTATEALLRRQFKEEIRKGEIELRRESRGLVISFKQAGIFDSGEADVKDTALPAMAKLANAMEQIPNQVRLEGHTDNQPISNDHFKNNWELSSARSIAFLQIITGKFHMPMGRLAVSGYADVVPIADNNTDAGRARNRRVDVVILSSSAAGLEPPTVVSNASSGVSQ